MSTVNLFQSLDYHEMSEPEAAVYKLRIEREALLRQAKRYHWARLHIQQFIEPGPAQDHRLLKLNENFPKGYARKELVAVNAEIAKAIVDLNNHQANNLKDGQHFNTRKHARRSWRDQ
jgi:hypothetical protein